MQNLNEQELNEVCDMIVAKCGNENAYRRVYIDMIFDHLSQYIGDDILELCNPLTKLISTGSLTNYAADDIWALIQNQLYKNNNFKKIISILLECMPYEERLSTIEVEMLFEEKDEELFGPDGCSGETRSYNFSTNQYDYYDRDKHTLKKL